MVDQAGQAKYRREPRAATAGCAADRAATYTHSPVGGFEHDQLQHHYQTFGDPETPPVVLLHGFTSDGRMWHHQVGALAPDFFVIVPDLRGHGLSEAPDEVERYSVPACASDIAALLDHLEAGVAAVVGCSYGGMVALQCTLDFPAKVAALVLSDTSAAYEHPAYEEAFRERERGIDAYAARMAKVGAAGIARQEATKVRDEFIASGIRSARTRISTEAFLGSAHARRTRPDLLPRLGELAVPTMVCHGSEDPVLSGSTLMAAGIPGARVVAFEGVGHGVPARRPEAFTKVLLQFFADVEAGNAVAGSLVVADGGG